MITLSSDFGSPYPAAMKGVLCSQCDARLIDVAHDFPRQDVRAAAFWLREVLPWFPPAAHLVVVDPGVGTDRAALVVRAGEHAFVGPDNGVLVPAARRIAGGSADESGRDDSGDGSADVETFEVAIEDPESATFHGRDVFAPAAAAVHETGVEHAEDLDGVSPVDGFEDLQFPDPDVCERGPDGEPRVLSGEVLVVDGFGNAITNVSGTVLDGRFGESVRVNGESVPVERSYAHVASGERLLTVGSHGNVELSANRGRGDEAFGVGRGAGIELVLE